MRAFLRSPVVFTVLATAVLLSARSAGFSAEKVAAKNDGAGS